jgi:hypothetical protein
MKPTFFDKLKNFFAKLIFSRQNFFGIFEKGNLSEQKKIWREKKYFLKIYLNFQKCKEWNWECFEHLQFNIL